MTCPHIARRFHVRPSGIIVWRCLTCDEWHFSRTWAEFDGLPANHKYAKKEVMV